MTDEIELWPEDLTDRAVDWVELRRLGGWRGDDLGWMPALAMRNLLGPFSVWPLPDRMDPAKRLRPQMARRDPETGKVELYDLGSATWIPRSTSLSNLTG